MEDYTKILCSPIYLTCYDKKHHKTHGFTFYVRMNEKTQSMYHIFMKAAQYDFGNIDIRFGEPVALTPNNVWNIPTIDYCLEQNISSGMLLTRKNEDK